MKLKANDYVRTKTGVIAKVLDEVLDGCCGIKYYVFNTDVNPLIQRFGNIIYKDKINVYISKSSSNIIDLIEVGDYVNGYKVSEIFSDKLKFGNDEMTLCFKGNHDTYYLYVEDIKSILTKQQFESMEYKL